jgi:uncharacterized integral membrane protein (TIGR00697 family)
MKIDEKLYASLCALFSVLVVMSNLVYQKFVYLPILPFYAFELSVGAIFYPLTFLITNLIAEFYGRGKAKFCVRLAISMSIIVALAINIMAKLDATPWSKIDNNIFNTVFGVYGTSLVGSIIASYTAQLIDIKLYLWIRKTTNNKFLWLRNLSSAISLLVDTSIVIAFITTFSTSIPLNQMLPLIFNSYCFKLFFTICTTPLFYGIVYFIKSKFKL